MSIYFAQIHPSCRQVHTVHMYSGEKQAENKLALTYRLTYVKAGSLYYAFDDKHVLLKKGDILFLPPGQVYSTYQGSREEQHISVFFSFQKGDYFDGITVGAAVPFLGALDHGYLIKKRTSIMDTQVFDEAFYCENAVVLYPMLTQLLKEFNERQIHHMTAVNAWLTQILVQILRLREGNHGSKQAKAVEEIISYINEHYAEAITCQSVAAYFHYHPNYINQLMKTAVGTSLHTYIANTKVHYAGILLTKTTDSVSSIAEQLGFSSLSRFSSFFRSVTGVSPSAWREKQMRTDI